VRAVKPEREPVDVGVVTSLGATAATGTGDIESGARVTPLRPSKRPVPERVPELAHLNLDRLRAYRRTLLEEELRTSYWRRIIQARRDLLRTRSNVGDREALRDALTEARGLAGRQAILALHPDGGMPILPNLPDLWDSIAGLDGEQVPTELLTKLASAESVLSSYREALHKRLDRATSDLVARYHEDPTQCLSALPRTG
jgi:RsiG-like